METRDAVIKVRVTAAEKECLEDAATKKGLLLSPYVRSAALENASITHIDDSKKWLKKQKEKAND